MIEDIDASLQVGGYDSRYRNIYVHYRKELSGGLDIANLR